jgi:hypothetical protein
MEGCRSSLSHGGVVDLVTGHPRVLTARRVGGALAGTFIAPTLHFLAGVSDGAADSNEPRAEAPTAPVGEGVDLNAEAFGGLLGGEKDGRNSWVHGGSGLKEVRTMATTTQCGWPSNTGYPQL